MGSEKEEESRAGTWRFAFTVHGPRSTGICGGMHDSGSGDGGTGTVVLRGFWPRVR